MKWSMYAKFLAERQRAWSASTACLLKGACRRLVCCNVACTWRGWGYSFPPSDEVVHAWTPFFLRGLMWKGLKWYADRIYVGDGLVQCFDLTWWQGVFLIGPLPLTESCTHVTIHPFKTKYSMSRYVACLTHLECAGNFASTPPAPAPRLGHARIRIYRPTWAWHGEAYINDHCSHNIQSQINFKF
jgi:hypothetical protein